MRGMELPPSQPPAIPPGMPPGGPSAPSEAPMMSPQKAAGDEAMADVNAKMAMDVLTNLLPIYGVGSEKGKTLMEVLNKLSRSFGVDVSKHHEAVPAEIAALVASLKGGPGMPS